MNNNKRVLQISLDILVGANCDGGQLTETVENELNRRGFNVLGAMFQDDMTETYMKHYPELLHDTDSIMKYFDIHVAYSDDAGYSIFVAAENEDAAVEKANINKLFVDEYDFEDIDYIQKISKEEYDRAQEV